MDGQTTTYVLGLAAGLTQVLEDGSNTYLYGLGRIAEDDGTDWLYHHGDALGSVRLLTDDVGAAVGVHSYAPYGDVLSGEGISSAFQYTGELRDASGLTYLRARYYHSGLGVFTSHDLWSGNVMRPGSMNGWNYAEGNPLLYNLSYG